jgi:CRP/FNR family transcriptional regulator, cyclic AMP receptor protein
MVDIASLQKYSLFGALMPEEIERIVPLLGSEAYGAGAVIIGEGELNGCIRFVLEGRVEVSRDGIRLNEIGEGDTFGEMEILDVMPAVATCRALTQTRFATISNKTLHEIFHIDAHIFAIIIMNLARDLSRRLRRMDELAAVSKKMDKS